MPVGVHVGAAGPGSVTIDAGALSSTSPDMAAVQALRASFFAAGPILVRNSVCPRGHKAARTRRDALRCFFDGMEWNHKREPPGVMTNARTHSIASSRSRSKSPPIPLDFIIELQYFPEHVSSSSSPKGHVSSNAFFPPTIKRNNNN